MNFKLKTVKMCVFVFTLIFFSSCQKDEAVGTVNIAKVNVINAVVAGGAIKVNVGNKTLPWSSIADAQTLGGISNLNRFYILSANMPTYLKVVPVSDTTKLWFDQVKQFDTGEIYTLYLSGTSGNVKTLFHKEVNFPKTIIRDAGRRTPSTDSIVNIRFVNLSPSGPKVDISIPGKGNNEVSDLSYEAFTDFKVYSATHKIEYFIFEIRNSSTKQLLSTIYIDPENVRFKSIAVMMMGIYPGLGLPYSDKYKILYITYE